MASFIGKCILVSAVMFFGVLLGMQQANNGMLEMKGYKDPDLKGALSFSEGEAKEASILGHQIDLEEKQKELEQLEAFNFFSSAGRALADSVTNSARSLYDWIKEKTD
ncbi:YqxA family protein [Bacillus sonorensis]|uniref:YqxA family protein n=1 Tax=Bacillus sonorensis TaxID=119858 RepID=UPI0004982F08|nr:YqxA family protein [Bacillus sonorensis]MCF7617734.1 YqxA family protein [Bacillus sonorensis]MCY8088034.1 YqxA family protein [Bacillus sonorensis]MCZ0067404.1 YqxA family protein [Bacillus sonorensis]MCZ0095934.1 YqxA family protein [Bacillus sonorensis]MEC1355388.1 YqxA family protein [Bacillus sonorensis]